MELANQKILLIGAGNMGGALLDALIDKGVPKANFLILKKNPTYLREKGWNAVDALGKVSAAPAIVIIAVKPQSIEGLLPLLAQRFRIPPLYISVAAGKTLGFFEHHLGNAPIVRAMPNTPAMIRKGISAMCANAHVTPVEKQLAEDTLKAAGEVVWIEDESLMDVVTAISGSGPAYVFLFMEAIVHAGVKNGLPEHIARKLAAQTLAGSAALSQFSEDQTLATLRENVTSPGGTTEAALKVLMQDNTFSQIIKKAVEAAITRGKELANG